MRILFNALGCGLGNNGGSKTIVTCCTAINSTPYNSAGVDTCSNSYNYTPNEAYCVVHPQHYTTYIEDYFDYDVVINVSVWDVDITLRMPINKKVWWVRGIEKWVNGEGYFFEKIEEFAEHGTIFVNSSWMVDYINKMTEGRVTPIIQFSGFEFDQYFDFKLRGDYGDTINIGAVWNGKHRTKNYDVFEKVEEYFCEYEKYKFFTLKNDLDSYNIRKFYNNIDIWLALSSLEGFHQCPIEAAMCGCLIVYNDIDSGGTRDYCSETTGMPVKTFADIVYAIENPEFEKVEVMQKYIKENIPSKRDAMIEFIKKIEEL